jgi:hypothetical protein
MILFTEEKEENEGGIDSEPQDRLEIPTRRDARKTGRRRWEWLRFLCFLLFNRRPVP